MSKEARFSEARQRLLEIQKRGGLAADARAVNQPQKTPPGPIPASFSQEQVWRLDQTAAALAPLHNESITIHRRGSCDVATLEKCLAEIVRRHEIWRTTFDSIEGRPVQTVHDAPASYKLLVSDLRDLPAPERESRGQELATQDATEPFDLHRLPLIRTRLVTLDDTHHRLYLTAHQIIVDGVTVFDVFPKELSLLYESFVRGKPSPLPETQTQYSDFAYWQRQTMANVMLEKQLNYWQNQLSGKLPVLPWPNEVARPEKQTYRGAIHPFRLSRQLTESLTTLGRQEGATVFMILLAALMVLLHGYTKFEDIVVGTLGPSGRKRREYQQLVGYFLNPVPLRGNLSGNPSFRALLHQMRSVTVSAISNDDAPFDLITQRVEIEPDPSRNPLFTIVLSVAPPVPQLPPGWDMTFMDVESGGARWDLYLEMSECDQGIIGRAQYNPDLFSAQKIDETVEDFRQVLERVADHPGQRLSDLR